MHSYLCAQLLIISSHIHAARVVPARVHSAVRDLLQVALPSKTLLILMQSMALVCSRFVLIKSIIKYTHCMRLSSSNAYTHTHTISPIASALVSCQQFQWATDHWPPRDRRLAVNGGHLHLATSITTGGCCCFRLILANNSNCNCNNWLVSRARCLGLAPAHRFGPPCCRASWPARARCERAQARHRIDQPAFHGQTRLSKSGIETFNRIALLRFRQTGAIMVAIIQTSIGETVQLGELLGPLGMAACWMWLCWQSCSGRSQQRHDCARTRLVDAPLVSPLAR